MTAYVFTCDTGYLELNPAAVAGVFVSAVTGARILWKKSTGEYCVYLA